jgi:hypothetical protein
MRVLSILLALILLFAGALPARAQDGEELTLRMSRNFGYSSGTGRVQGTFTLKASGPEDLARVVFYIDDELIGEAGEAPFDLRFVTDSYPLGPHTLHALGYTAGGQELRSNEIHAEFVSAEEGMQAATKIMLPLLGFVLLAMLLSFAFTFVGSRKHANLPPGAPRKYGVAGGAICPRCSRPYPRHFWAPNLLLGKLERCPFCGKWAIVPAAPLDMLQAAEQAELHDAQGEAEVGPLSEAERLRRDLEDSRYQDL